jgi:hypothetical protein
MLFIETSIFTKQIKDLVSDEEYRQLQQDLLVQPDRGDLIKNGGGIRKVRCAQGNKGKSGFRIRCIMLILENLHYYYFKISLISKHKTRLSRLLLTVKLS